MRRKAALRRQGCVMSVKDLGSRRGRWLGWAASVLVGVTLAATVQSPASANAPWLHKHLRHARHHVTARAPAYNPPFSAIVVDANTGRELYGSNENAPRHPASITKVMTLYLLFEKLESGEMTLQSRIPISEHAAAQQPSKLGIQPGDSIAVEDAIKAVVTRSANDVAVAIAEAVGHDESNFADMMTRKAHALGMSRTVYRNASGLPNEEQITTAHDLAVLARAVQERFPKYFHYFSTHEFEYAGEVIGNHNHLLGKVEGVDGIKTGFTNASGFNLMTSVHRDGRSLVAIVMGGRSAGIRDHIMENLIEDHIAQASGAGHTAPMIAENDSPVPATAEPAIPAARPATAPAVAAPARPALAALRAPANDSGEGDDSGDDDDTPAVRPGKATHVVAHAPTPPAPLPPPAAARVAASNPAALGWSKGPQGVAAPHPELTRIARADAAAPAHAGWVIQIGATDDADKANDLLSRARAQSHGALASAKPFTEKFRKDGDTFYRARFAGLDSDAADKACRSLKRSGIPCFATHVD